MKMRNFVSLAGVAGVLAVAACSGTNNSNDEFKKDLERASTASEITLPTAQPAQQVVSSIERTSPPAPRRVAQSQRAPKHKPAPVQTPAPVEAEQADVTEEVEVAPAEPSPAPVAEAPIPSPRPQPVASTGTGGGTGGVGSGRGGVGVGDAIGIIGVVLRGGVVDGDECDPRTDGRRPRGNGGIISRVPIIGTFPGTGRLGSPPIMVGTGRVRSPTIGDARGAGRVRY
jgi:hypothetical protein